MSYFASVTRSEHVGVERYRPILEQEWVDLLGEMEGVEYQEADEVTWTTDAGEKVVFWYDEGCITTRNPQDSTIRHLATMARRLDAWVCGEEGERYGDNGHVVRGEDEAVVPWVIVRADEEVSGSVSVSPLDEEEWLDCARRYDDFRIVTSSEVTLPAGRRTLEHPELASWIGHPSSEPVPFFYLDDGTGSVHVFNHDDATVRRMRDLATELGAVVGELGEYD